MSDLCLQFVVLPPKNGQKKKKVLRFNSDFAHSSSLILLSLTVLVAKLYVLVQTAQHGNIRRMRLMCKNHKQISPVGKHGKCISQAGKHACLFLS